MNLDEKDKCPYCEEPMTKGFLMSEKNIYWHKNMPNHIFAVSRKEKKLSQFIIGKGAYLKARRCNECGLTLILKREQKVKPLMEEFHILKSR